MTATRVACAFRVRRAYLSGLVVLLENSRREESKRVIGMSARDGASRMLPRRRATFLARGWEGMVLWQAKQQPFSRAVVRGDRMRRRLLSQRRWEDMVAATGRWHAAATYRRLLHASERAAALRHSSLLHMRRVVIQRTSLTQWYSETRRLIRRKRRVREQLWHMAELQNSIDRHLQQGVEGYLRGTAPPLKPPLDQLLRMGVAAKTIDPRHVGSCSALGGPRPAVLRLMSAGVRRMSLALQHELADICPTPQTELFRDAAHRRAAVHHQF